MNQRGYTLQTVILASIFALAAVGAAIVIFNLIADRSGDITDVPREVLDPFYEDQALDNPPPIPEGVEPIKPDIIPTTPNDDTTEEKGFYGGHKCALHHDGTVSCWHQGELGQLGNGGLQSSATPIGVQGINDATTIAADGGRTCVVHEGGEVSCWGSDWINNKPYPSKLEGLSNIVDISAGSSHTCVVHEDATISCWGDGGYGRLGDGKTYAAIIHLSNEPGGVLNPDAPLFSNAPVKVVGITDAVAVSAGYQHTCAIHSDGTISCWGGGGYGRLGDGVEYAYYKIVDSTTIFSTEDKPKGSNIPVKVAGITDAVAVAAGYQHTCAIHSDGTISCWGAGNFDGILGDGKYAESNTPVKVYGIRTAVDISLGRNHTCALHRTSEISCWGNPDLGQLGVGDKNALSNFGVPRKIVNEAGEKLSGFIAVSAGGLSTCGLHRDGTVSCWGFGAYSYETAYPTTGRVLTYDEISSLPHVYYPKKLATIEDLSTIRNVKAISLSTWFF